MISVCLPSAALLQHLPSYLGFSYLGHGVSLHSCSSKAQPLLLTLDEGYLLTAALPDLQCGMAPPGPPVLALPRLLGRVLTLLTSLLDFADNGVLDVFIDEPSVKLREMTIGADAPGGPGLLRGHELATTFSFLRPNDLVWNNVVGNYLKGEEPTPFDLLYWNGDSTNLPGPMFCWYLRHTYLQDELTVPGMLTVCGQSVDLGAIAAPAFIYASREDHIVP